MTDNNWKWYAGSNDEYYSVGPCDTRQEAIDEGRGNFGHESGFYIIEAEKVNLTLADYIGADVVLEEAEERACDLGDEDGTPIFDVTEDQEKDLISHLRNACDAWQTKHNLIFVPWHFTNSSNAEFIEADKAGQND